MRYAHSCCGTSTKPFCETLRCTTGRQQLENDGKCKILIERSCPQLAQEEHNRERTPRKGDEVNRRRRWTVRKPLSLLTTLRTRHRLAESLRPPLRVAGKLHISSCKLSTRSSSVSHPDEESDAAEGQFTTRSFGFR